jgi:hypothetical protein
MIRVDIGEQFPIIVSLIDEDIGQNASGQTVYYDIRDTSDNPLSPSVAGTLTESSVELGIYKAVESINTAGIYVIYATCSGFTTNTEELIVNSESIYDVTKQTHNYNISVEDVVRTTADVDRTASQIARKVPLGKTDYLITWIKADDAVDWSNPTSSGIVWAWYETTSALLPYKMGGPSI